MDEVRREERELTTADIAGASREERPRREQRIEPEPAEPGRGVPVEGEPEGPSPLFDPARSEELRKRWAEVQTGFVDEPRAAVERADGLVAEAIKDLAATFAAERERLESQWDRGSDVSTEDLRQALRRYRSFFDRLLSV